MINVEKYEALGFQNFQIEEIKLAIKNNVSDDLINKWMLDTHYDSYQLEQIRLGLQNNLDVSIYARYNIPAEEMEHIRLQELENKAIKEEADKKALLESKKKEKKEYKKANRADNVKSILSIILILLLIAMLSAIAYLSRDYIKKLFVQLDLDLVSEHIELNVYDSFDPDQYVKYCTEGDDIIKIYPSFFANELGDYNLEYYITNNVRTTKKILKVSVVDKTPPTIKLSKDEIQLTRDVDEFNSDDYLVDVSDNYDKDLEVKVDNINWKEDEQDIRYIVEDSSGNKAVSILKVFLKDKPKPAPVITNHNNNQSTQQTQPNDNSSNNNTQQSQATQQTQQTQSQQQQPKPQQQTPSQTQPSQPQQSGGYINGVHSISVKKGTDVGDVVYMLTSGVDASGNISVDFSSVNTSVAGSYPVYFTTSDGASASCSVTVTE